jgi:hypothetical protein
MAEMATVHVWLPPSPIVKLCGLAVMEKSGAGGVGAVDPPVLVPPPHPIKLSAKSAKKAKPDCRSNAILLLPPKSQSETLALSCETEPT